MSLSAVPTKNDRVLDLDAKAPLAEIVTKLQQGLQPGQSRTFEFISSFNCTIVTRLIIEDHQRFLIEQSSQRLDRGKSQTVPFVPTVAYFKQMESSGADGVACGWKVAIHQSGAFLGNPESARSALNIMLQLAVRSPEVVKPDWATLEIRRDREALAR